MYALDPPLESDNNGDSAVNMNGAQECQLMPDEPYDPGPGPTLYGMLNLGNPPVIRDTWKQKHQHQTKEKYMHYTITVYLV